MAAAYAARTLGMEPLITVPETTSEKVRDRLCLEGAEVRVFGSVWNETDVKARQDVCSLRNAVERTTTDIKVKSQHMAE